MHTDLKTTLANFTAQQKADFAHADVMDLLHQRSDFYDELLAELWLQHGLADRTDLALLAVGGYGRREMFPLSDLDILILCEQQIDESTQQTLNALFNLLWDSKLQLGTAIRTLDECVEIGKAEISVATNMFESRFLLGNQALWQALMSRLYQDDFWAIGEFYQAKMAERKAQYARYHNTSYNLEPDLKHSPGGLRDLHLISWIMLRQHGVYSLDNLLERGVLFPEEFAELKQAQAVLFRMRFALHLQLKRYDNRLRFDRQLQLSEQLGYVGEGNQPVEAMMKTFFQATQSISQLSQLLLESFEQTHLQILQKVGNKHPLDPLYFLRDNVIFCHNPRIFSQQPHLILDLFWHLTQHPTATASTQLLRQLRLALQKLDRPLCELPEARACFIKLFRQPNVASRAIVPMHRLGVLSAYLPQWQGIEGLMQFDLFHMYTVDEHTVRVMLKLESFLDENNREKHPLCCELLPKLADLPLLCLAALFHDIAKGREGDHAQVGAVEMRQFAELHGFSPAETDYMAWLVAEHLTMSITAQRRDIHDPDVVKTFANIVKNPNSLAALTCLTVADICATNETLWNDWKRSLFRKLHQFTTEQLALGEQQLDYHQFGVSHREQAFAQLQNQLTAEQCSALTQFWRPCPESYFVRHNPTQLVWHAVSYLENSTLPMVLVSNKHARGATEIFVCGEDQPQLFARIAQTLSAKKISIHDAQVLTSDNGLVLDSFIVTEFNGTPLNAERLNQIQQALLKTLQTDKKIAFKLQKKPIKHQSFKGKTRVRFLPQSQPNQTAFELFTPDREGLLAQIGYIFSQQQLQLLNAKITTIGEKVEDFFVVTTASNRALNDEQKQMLKEKIIGELHEFL
ncbi:MAG: bifunctional uridylyltransferase/uridylyl-removing protein GlnD [Pasteurellaceae bacterium]|nr:bifunctional uridylyltransferase/uridylyl-removing protein GlnD [Pasteurellaceae bacterium]